VGETHEERAARLLAAGYGRRRMARELDITEHEAPACRRRPAETAHGEVTG
jgi:hypothetical protein